MGVKMSENLKLFREFVETHPQIKVSVKDKERTWQEFYEDYIILGPYDNMWKKYKIETNEKEERSDTKMKTKKDVIANTEFWKSAYNYVKKIDGDKVTKTLGNAQKVLNIFQGFVGGGKVQSGFKQTGDPLFDKKFDEWY